MDIKRLIFPFCLCLPFALQIATADTVTNPPDIPDGQVFVPPVQSPVTTTAEVWNKSKVEITVSQKSVAQQTVQAGQSYKSQTYPEYPINIKLPDEGGVKYVTVTGQKSACTVPVCIFVQ